MASRLNPCGPAQTYMIGRVWACSCAAGFPSPSAVSPAGMGWRVWGCWALPSTIQGSVSSYRGTGFLRQTVCAQDEEGAPLHKLDAAPCRGAGGVVERDVFISQPCGVVRTSFSSAGVLIQVSVHGKI